jgi:hypothetical protein
VQASRGQWRALPAGASLDEAKRALAKLRGERSGRPGPQSAAPLTVGELAALYFESRLHLKPSTRRADAQLFLCHLAPVFGELPLRQVRADAVRVWETRLRDEADALVSAMVWESTASGLVGLADCSFIHSTVISAFIKTAKRSRGGGSGSCG